jgi:hypothetical protein
MPDKLNCGKCFGCRMEHARQWTVRLTHEHSLHRHSTAVHLTYNDEHLPDRQSLDKTHIPLFMKRLRNQGFKFRYFQCGEYGEKKHRPHHHAILLGVEFPDAYHWMRSDRGTDLYRSRLLENAWPFGFSTLGSVDDYAIKYVCGYLQKKQKQADYWEQVVPATGEITSEERIPPYATMSRRPAIGRRWIERYWREVYPSDTVVYNGRAMRPPRYYDRWLETEHPDLHAEVMAQRAEIPHNDDSPARLRCRETVAELNANRFSPRELE